MELNYLKGISLEFEGNFKRNSNKKVEFEIEMFCLRLPNSSFETGYETPPETKLETKLFTKLFRFCFLPNSSFGGFKIRNSDTKLETLPRRTLRLPRQTLR